MENEAIVLKVSSDKQPGYAKKVAAALGWRLREDGYAKMRAIKEDAVNSAIKAVAIVNERVKPAGICFSVSPFFDQAVNAKDPSAVVLSMSIEAAPEKPTKYIFVEYKVSGKHGEENDSASRLAGAIAGAVRDGKVVRLRCIGASSVYKCMLSCTIAKGYVFANGLNSIIVPTWADVDGNSGKISLMQVEFWGIKAES